MKAVMISIRPEWVHKILSGEKTVEVRKTAPKIETPFKCYIYCTLSGSNELFREILNGDVAEWNRGKWSDRKGNVVAEFICNRVEDFTTNYYTMHRPQTLRIAREACISLHELNEYEGNAICLYGWHISDLKVYDKPKKLSEFKPWHRECFYSDLGLAIPKCHECHKCKIERPPQSWCYVEEL